MMSLIYTWRALMVAPSTGRIQELGFKVYEKMLKRKYAMDKNTKQNFENYRKNALMIHDQRNGEDFFLPKKSRVSHSQYAKIGRAVESKEQIVCCMLYSP
ncbi:unnamed protein product [Ilex paraguariensis]|uniref:Cathepsin propeptide inhibitor domain-containing protein n=1 Tax=Ilex paraguariensis TaxID=185542 RepID=A0ABC8SFJ9_9AQUA